MKITSQLFQLPRIPSFMVESNINIKYHFIREQVSDNNIKLVYCQTDEMVVDMLTKALGRVKFEKFREMAGVLPMPDCQSEEEC